MEGIDNSPEGSENEIESEDDGIPDGTPANVRAKLRRANKSSLATRNW